MRCRGWRRTREPPRVPHDDPIKNGTMTIHTNSRVNKAIPNPVETIFEKARQIVLALADKAQQDDVSPTDPAFKEAAAALASLPLPRDDYFVAQLRLVNGKMCLVHGEHGAAAYELRQLARSLNPRSTVTR